MSLNFSSLSLSVCLANGLGIDYNIKVERPEDLGGGQMETFLRLDQFIFVSKV